jgi:hypothetical protein
MTVTTNQPTQSFEILPTGSPKNEIPLPLTETYNGGSFSFKYPSGYAIYSDSQLYLVNKKYESSFRRFETVAYPISYFSSTGKRSYNYTRVDPEEILKYSVLRIGIYGYTSDNAYFWAYNALMHDESGNTYGRIYKNARSEDVNYDNIKWTRITEENVNETKINIVSDKTINYLLRYRTPQSEIIIIEYGINSKYNGNSTPKDNFNEATLEEIVKSFTIVEE